MMRLQQNLQEQYPAANNNLLAFIELPKRVLLSEIDSRNCIHNAVFCLLDQKCWGCDIGPECLHVLDKFNEFNVDADEKRIKATLVIAIAHIEKKIHEWGHQPRICVCETCVWLRDIRKVMSSSAQNESD